MMKSVDLNGQLDILRIIDPSVDIEKLKKTIIQIPRSQPIDEHKFKQVRLVNWSAVSWTKIFYVCNNYVHNN